MEIINQPIKSTPISITITGNGENDIAPSFFIQMEKDRYLFNIPEGTQRLFMENKLKLPRLNRLLFTTDNPVYWSGYPGALLTYFSTEFISTPIHCVDRFIESINESDIIPNSASLLKRIPDVTTDNTVIFDDNFTFTPIVTECHNIKTINYHVLLPTFLGKFDAEKAKQLNIPGPLRGKLMKGETVTLANGTVVNQSDVCGNPICPGSIVVLHLPTIDHFNEYMKNEIQTEVCCFIVISNQTVRQYQPFQEFISKHKNVQLFHLQDRISLSSQEIIQSTTKTSFRLVNDLHKAIGTILPQFAPESIRKENIPSTTPTKQQLQNKDLITQALVQYTLYPKFQVTPIKRDNVFDIPKITPMQIQQPNQLQFQVILLGTGGAVPGKSRNVSAEILRYNDKVIMIDIGESTIFTALNAGIHPDDINLLYITHAHGDHIFGIISLFKLRTKPLLVVAPECMKKGIESLSHIFNVQTRFIENSIFANRELNQTLIEEIQNELETVIITKKLQHYEENYGVRFEMNGTSIVFTGDTRVCEEDKQLCMNADYVVHECNFEDGMETEAENRLHSTPTSIEQALKDCNVKIIVMNHIGQRTSKFSDITNKDYSIPMIYSFDGMVFDNSLEVLWKEYKHYLHEFFTLNEIDENE